MITVDESSFDEKVLKAGSPVLALFYASWCPFCRSFIQHFEEIQREGFVVVNMDDYGSSLWERFGIEVVPTLILFADGEEAARADGVRGRGLKREDLLRMVEKLGMLERPV